MKKLKSQEGDVKAGIVNSSFKRQLHFVGMDAAVAKVSGDLKPSSFDGIRPPPPPSPPNSSLVLTTRPHRQTVSYLTCSKLCAICFVAGIVFGYSLRGRVKRWASKMLKKLG